MISLRHWTSLIPILEPSAQALTSVSSILSATESTKNCESTFGFLFHDSHCFYAYFSSCVMKDSDFLFIVPEIILLIFKSSLQCSIKSWSERHWAVLSCHHKVLFLEKIQVKRLREKKSIKFNIHTHPVNILLSIYSVL